MSEPEGISRKAFIWLLHCRTTSVINYKGCLYNNRDTQGQEQLVGLSILTPLHILSVFPHHMGIPDPSRIYQPIEDSHRSPTHLVHTLVVPGTSFFLVRTGTHAHPYS
jgi:hypothetical protein